MGNLQQTGHGPGAITFQCESKFSLTCVVTLFFVCRIVWKLCLVLIRS